MADCEFCKLYKCQKAWNRRSAKEMNAEGKPIRSICRVALVVDTYHLWCHNHGGTTTYRPMKLKYCPTCGKKLH